MANVNCYMPTNVKPDQPVNSQYIQKILDENVGLIHAIIEKQQQNQEAEDLLKSLHKNLIYLATIADQTTSAGNTSNAVPVQQHQYNYPQSQIAHPPLSNQNFPSSMSQHPSQSSPYVTQSSMVISQSGPIETLEKKPQSSNDDSYKEINIKPESTSSVNVDIDRDMEKCHLMRSEPNHHPVAVSHKNVDIDKDCSMAPASEMAKEIGPQSSANSSEYIQKFDETNASTTSSHMPNPPTIKTDMPPPSQPIGGIHQDKNPMQQQQQYPGNQRNMYPGVAPGYNQYNPHFDQNSKFYPQNMYQHSYNYQGGAMYNPYNQPVAPPPAGPGHYNQHIMNSPMYPQYPYYQQPGTMDQMPPGPPKDACLPQQMYPPNTMPQSMYPPPPQNSMPQPMHPPSTLSQSMKIQNSESLTPSNSHIAE